MVAIEYDPIRSARLALLEYKDGERRYIIAPVGLQVGATLKSGGVSAELVFDDVPQDSATGTVASIALLYRDPNGHGHLWTGDSLFPGGVGNTQKDAARFASLIDDVEHKLFDRLPDDTWFYPGHGNERPATPEWRPRGW